jgi:hypothetical protein
MSYQVQKHTFFGWQLDYLKTLKLEGAYNDEGAIKAFSIATSKVKKVPHRLVVFRGIWANVHHTVLAEIHADQLTGGRRATE